jgi:hypothetical protein
MIKPKKYIKKYHFGDFDYEKELNRLLNELSGQIQSSNRGGPANWIVCSPQVADSINSMIMESQIGDWRIEDNSFIQDIQLRPRRVPQYLNLDISITNTDNNYFL